MGPPAVRELLRPRRDSSPSPPRAPRVRGVPVHVGDDDASACRAPNTGGVPAVPPPGNASPRLLLDRLLPTSRGADHEREGVAGGRPHFRPRLGPPPGRGGPRVRRPARAREDAAD